MDKRHYGSTLDSLFQELGALREMNERLSKRIFVEQLRDAMKRRRISPSEFARRMNISGTAARRLLDHTVPGVTLESLVSVSASSAVGMAFEPRLKLRETQKRPTSKKHGVTTGSGHDGTTAACEKKYGRRRYAQPRHALNRGSLDGQ